MNNPVSSFLRRPPPSSKCGASGSLQCADVSNLRKSSDKGDFHDVQKGKVVDERLDNEDEWNECSDWLSEAGEVARLTLIAPVSSIELIGKSLSQTADSDYAPASRGDQRIYRYRSPGGGSMLCVRMCVLGEGGGKGGEERLKGEFNRDFRCL